MSAILVTGGGGQLARALANAAPGRVRVVGRPAFDFDLPESLDALFEAPPAVLINAAAYTAVDAAEADADAARRANAEGPGRLAALCALHGTKLIHVSTDYVFDGAKGAPYAEGDAPNPTGVYGATKLAGEQEVLAALPSAVILRTSWVYAAIGKNFVRTILNAAKRGATLRVVADQIGCPTNADDLAQAALAVAAALAAGADAGGIYHAAGSGHTSWHGFARAILAAAAPHGWPNPDVTAIATADWPTPARRPADSRLDGAKLRARFGVSLPPWQPSLIRTVATICSAEQPG
jgi:dTDP-4-dehydrorhamnose reductase